MKLVGRQRVPGHRARPAGHGQSDPDLGRQRHGHLRRQDLAELIDTLDLNESSSVGHSTGGGEVVRWQQHGAGRVAKVVTAGAVPPLMLQSATNPDGTPIEAFDQIRAGVLADRSQFYQDLSVPFFGANRRGLAGLQGLRDQFWRHGHAGRAQERVRLHQGRSPRLTSPTTSRRSTVPILIAQGDDDQIVPIKDAALKSIELVKNGTLKMYPGAPHGIAGPYQQSFDADLLAFISS